MDFIANTKLLLLFAKYLNIIKLFTTPKKESLPFVNSEFAAGHLEARKQFRDFICIKVSIRRYIF